MKLFLENELRDGIKSGDLTRVKRAVESGVNVNNALPGYSYNALYLAIDIQNVDAVNYLINNTNCEIEYEDWWYNCHTPLTFAINKNSLKIVELLIARGADVNRIHSDGDTPLTHAIRLNKLQIAEYLLKQKADIDQVGWKEKTPLSWAVSKNNLEAVKLLVSHGANKNAPNGNGSTPLELAKNAKNYEIADFLEFGEKLTKKEKRRSTGRPHFNPIVNSTLISTADSTFNSTAKSTVNSTAKASTLSTASSTGSSQVERIKPMVGLGIQVALNEAQLKDSEGNTPLIIAINVGDLGVVQEVLASGADPCKPGANGKTPLSLAVQKCDLDLIELLLDNGAEHNIQTALLEAIVLEQVEIVKLLLEREVLINIIYKNGCTPLTRAIDTGRLEIVQVLVDYGANINMPDRDGNFPLAQAVKRDNLDIVKYLVNCTQPPDVLLEKCTFLLKYIEEQNFEMVELFVGLGAKLNVVFDSGCTPLIKAVQVDNFKLVRFLVGKGADVNLADNTGKVALATAASNQNLRIVKFLMGAGADIQLAKKELDKYANTCEDFAIYLDVSKGKYKQWESRTSLNVTNEDVDLQDLRFITYPDSPVNEEKIQ